MSCFPGITVISTTETATLKTEMFDFTHATKYTMNPTLLFPVTVSHSEVRILIRNSPSFNINVYDLRGEDKDM
jgi:hypothetical protein